MLVRACVQRCVRVHLLDKQGRRVTSNPNSLSLYCRGVMQYTTLCQIPQRGASLQGYCRWRASI